MNDNLILVGMMGAGKSAVGRLAAQTLGLRFVDADEKIRQDAGKSIADIFAQDGEESFRNLEAKALTEILSADGAVVATGGGAILRPENRALMRKRGAIVYLDAAAEVLRARLDAQPDKGASRPLLQNGKSVAELRRLRAPLYQRVADFSVNPGGGETANDTAKRMLRVMDESPSVVRVPLSGGRDYPVVVGRGLLDDVRPWLGDSPQTVIVAPPQVFKLHGARAVHGGASGGVAPLPDGEERKTMETALAVLDQFAKAQLGRDGTVMTLGGGVTGDVGGFAAAIYMRGVRLLQAPTTLLAMVDAAIGGKTGVNHPQGKNLIGAFHQPVAVLCDLETLETLPPAEMRAGLAEVVKYGLLGDAAFFRWLEENADAVASFEPSAIRRIVIRSARAKAAIVAADEKESDSRALLNLGHTFAHAIEAATGYGQWRHGEAVAAGLVAAAELSARVLNFPKEDVGRLRRLLLRLGLPSCLPAGLSRELREAMRMDKKNRAGRERFVLMRAPGEAAAGQTAAEGDLQAALEAASEGAQ